MRLRPTPTLLSVSLAAALVTGAARAQTPPAWVGFWDQTSTRLVAAAGVGVADPEEKDIAIGDVDNDGDMDVVIGRKVPYTVLGPRPNVLFLNVGGVMHDMTAQYAPGFLAFPDSTRAMRLADVDLDGWLDVVVANSHGQVPRIHMNRGNGPSGWLGFVDETAPRFPPFPIPPVFCGLGVGDASGDGYPDLFFGDYNNTLEDRLWFNRGSTQPGYFDDVSTTQVLSSYLPSGFNTTTAIADINGDGHGDLCKNSVSNVTIAFNNGSGGFFTTQNLNTGPVYAFTWGDLDNDGDLDAYFAEDDNDSWVINTGTAPPGTINWTSAAVAGTGGFNANPHMADVDDDGDLDVGVSDVDVDIPGCTRRFLLLRNNFPASPLLEDPYIGAQHNFSVNGTFDHAFVDIDGDGWLDLWIGHCGGNKIFIQKPRARTSTYGTGCAGTNGVPVAGASGLPRIGNASFAVTVASARPFAPAILFTSLASANIPFGSCAALVDLLPPNFFLGFGTATNAAGSGSVVLPIPLTESILGLKIFGQYAILDPAGGIPIAGGIALSDGIRIEVGI